MPSPLAVPASLLPGPSAASLRSAAALSRADARLRGHRRGSAPPAVAIAPLGSVRRRLGGSRRGSVARLLRCAALRQLPPIRLGGVAPNGARGRKAPEGRAQSCGRRGGSHAPRLRGVFLFIHIETNVGKTEQNLLKIEH